MGGMYTLVEAMERLFRTLGGEVRCGMPVEQLLLKERRTAGVRLEDGTVLEADIVVANSDVASTFLKLLPAAYRPKPTVSRMNRYRYSMSCFLLYLGINRQYEHLRHHTIIMPDHYQKLIRDIFDGQGIPDDLALYLHVPTRTDPSMAPPGSDSLYVLAPVPNLAHSIDWTREAPAFRDKVIRFLEQEAGLDGLETNIVTEHVFTPLDFASELRSHLGAAFSIEPTLFQSAYFRPHNRSDSIDGLYLVGAGTHPGAGIPGVLLSADITSRLVIEDLARA
jgi:phytoene desaturase